MTYKINKLMDKGVIFQNSGSVFISDEVDIDNIEEGVEIKPFCRIEGKSTFLSRGTIIGKEGQTVIENCVTGKDVVIGSGYFTGTAFLDGAKAGGNNHFREGCILEEKSSTAHCVGLKQTIIFPYATLGSLINFCDCMLTGGTSSSNHSEVGSSFIHFNFTPDQDKATPSILGNVHEGVFLDKDPIFLGGQGGIAGPVQLGFGNTTAAGTILRKDENRENRLILEGIHRNINFKRSKGNYSGLSSILKKNLFYIASLIALKNWYFYVRSNFYSKKIVDFTISLIETGIKERIKRIYQLAEKVNSSFPHMTGEKKDSSVVMMKKNFYENRDRLKNIILKSSFNFDIAKEKKDIFLQGFEKEKKDRYLDTILSLDTRIVNLGREWLFSIIEDVMGKAFLLLTEFEFGDFY